MTETTDDGIEAGGRRAVPLPARPAGARVMTVTVIRTPSQVWVRWSLPAGPGSGLWAFKAERDIFKRTFPEAHWAKPFWTLPAAAYDDVRAWAGVRCAGGGVWVHDTALEDACLVAVELLEETVAALGRLRQEHRVLQARVAEGSVRARLHRAVDTLVRAGTRP
jgi:hypothetical protein